MRGPAVVLGWTVFLAACGGAADAPPVQVADWEGMPLLEAEAEAFGPATFERVGGIARDGAGRTFVVDAVGDEIRVLDAEGAFLFSFASGGEGRGQVLGACCPAMGPDGLLWVRDRGNDRYQAFEVGEEGAEVRRVLPIRHSAATLWAPTTFDDRGRLVDAGLMVDQETRDTRPVRVHMNRTSGDVEGVAGLPQPPQERMGRASVTGAVDGRESTFYLYQPHGPRGLLAHGPGGRWAEAVSDTYAVRVVGPDGSVREIVGPGDAGPALSEAERAGARETLDGYRDRFELQEEEMPFGVPERKPPLRALHFDRGGRLWVELSTAGDVREAHVYGPEGTPVARYAWPAEVLLDVRSWIGREEAIGVTADGAEAPAGGAEAPAGGPEAPAGGATGERLVRLRLPVPGGP